MDAVLRVDLEAHGAGFLHHLIDAGRAVALGRLVIEGQVLRDGQAGVGQLQVAGLVLGMVGVGQEDGGELVEADDPVRLGVLGLLRLGGQRHPLMVGHRVLEGEGQAAAENRLVQPDHRRAKQEAKLVPPGPGVARPVEVLVQPGSLEGGFVAIQRFPRCAALHRFVHGFGSQDAGLHGRVGALLLQVVQKAGIVAHQEPAGHGELRQGGKAALDDRAGAIGDALAAREGAANQRMLLEALELVKGREVRVLVAQVNDEPHRHLLALQVVEVGAAQRLPRPVAEGPAHCVQHPPGLVLVRLDFPDLLEANAIVLGVRLCVQLEALDELLAQMPAAALGKNSVLGAEFIARLVAGLLLAVGANAHVASRDANNGAVLPVEDFAGGKAREEHDPQGLGALRQPAAEGAEAGGVLALVAHSRRHQEAGHAHGQGGAQQIVHLVLDHRHAQWRALPLPVRHQLVQRAGFNDRPGQEVRADFRALLHQADAGLLPGLGRKAGIADGGGQARRPSAHHHQVKLHGLSFHPPAPKMAFPPV